MPALDARSGDWRSGSSRLVLRTTRSADGGAMRSAPARRVRPRMPCAGRRCPGPIRYRALKDRSITSSSSREFGSPRPRIGCSGDVDMREGCVVLAAPAHTSTRPTAPRDSAARAGRKSRRRRDAFGSLCVRAARSGALRCRTGTTARIHRTSRAPGTRRARCRGKGPRESARVDSAPCRSRRACRPKDHPARPPLLCWQDVGSVTGARKRLDRP